MKTNRHSLMAKGILVLLSLLVIVFILTFAWFSKPEPVPASGLKANTRAGSDFEYAIGFRNSQTGGAYLVTDFTSNSALSLDIENLTVDDGHHLDEHGQLIHYNLLYDYTPTDITGDGSTLIRPNMEYGNWSVNTGTDDYSIAEPNTQYISFDIIVKSRSRAVLSMGPKSCAIGRVETNPGDGGLVNSSASNFNASTYGSFSRDAIVGAVRVAFLDFVDDNNDITVNDLLQGEMNDKLADTPSLLWVPRPDIYLNNNNRDQEVTGWSLNTGVQPNDRFDLVSQALEDRIVSGVSGSGYTTYRHQQYNIFNEIEVNNETVPDNHVRTNESSYVHISSRDDAGTQYHLNDSVPVTNIKYSETVTEDGNEVTYYYGKVRVRVWIEGTDTESRRALSGGKFKLSFDLTTN